MSNEDLILQKSCPCVTRTSLESIMDALQNQVLFAELLDWFSGSSCCEQCQTRRVAASFNLLNGIRFACKPHLEPERSGTDTKRSPYTTPQRAVVKPQKLSQDQFPTLQVQSKNSSNTSATTNPVPPLGKTNNNNAGKQKKKKRIRPLQTVAPSTQTLGVWGEIAKQPPQQQPATKAATTTLQGAWGKKSSGPTQQQHPVDVQQTPLQAHNSNSSTTTVNAVPSSGAWGTNKAIVPQPVVPTTSWTNNSAVVGQPKSPMRMKPKAPVTAAKPKSPTLPSNSAATVTPQPATPRKVIPAGDDATVQRLVQVYCSLVLQGLVPSTALEFHLLLRLLHIPDSTATSEGPLAAIFTNASRCRSFAIRALTKLSPQLRAFGISFWKDIIRSHCFRTHLPELTSELEGYIRDRMAEGSEKAAGTTSQTVVLALPFQADRDSRHNFKTREEVAMYKNREETRDAFLYQLRSFLNVKGKVVDTVQAQKAMDRIQQSFRVVLDGVIGANMPWFAQFFCELLLQIGLTPVEETDKDLLSIAGKEKLQKLHKRFSSKVGGTQSTKSSWKLASERSKNRSASSLPPHEQAKEYFPGHQEYFYLFLISNDSYKFNSHLRNQLVHRIQNNIQNSDNHYSARLEKALVQTQMLAKFLGVLVFSPCWQEADGNTNIYTDGAPPDGLQQLDSDAGVGLPLSSIVRQSEGQGTLTKVIPWVAELLKMASWDESLQSRSDNFRMLLILLRQIQERLRAAMYRGSNSKAGTPSFQLALWCLDVFFGEHVGLAASFSNKPQCVSTTTCSKVEPCSENAPDGASLDDSALMFSTSTLVAVNPHLEELFSLATTFANADHHRLSARSPGISRKLRPLMLSSGVELAKGDDGLVNRSSHPMNNAKASSNDTRKILPHGGNSLEAKMADMFFHQHQELKEICEFSVHRILKQVMKTLPERMARLKRDKEVQVDNRVTEQSESNAFIQTAHEFLRTNLQEGIQQSLSLLQPPNTHPKVHQMAASLAVARGYETGLPHVENLVANDLKSIQCSLFQESEQCGSTKDNGGEQPQTVQEAQLRALTEAINRLRTRISGGLTVDTSETIHQSLRALQPLVAEWVTSPDPKIPPETLLRGYFEAIAKLDRQSATLIRTCLGNKEHAHNIDASKRWMLLAEFLCVAAHLSSHPRRGFSQVRKAFASMQSIQELMELGLANDSVDGASAVLVALVKGDLVSEHDLKPLSLQVAEAGGSQIAELLAQRALPL